MYTYFLSGIVEIKENVDKYENVSCDERVK